MESTEKVLLEVSFEWSQHMVTLHVSIIDSVSKRVNAVLYSYSLKREGVPWGRRDERQQNYTILVMLLLSWSWVTQGDGGSGILLVLHSSFLSGSLSFWVLRKGAKTCFQSLKIFTPSPLFSLQTPPP